MRTIRLVLGDPQLRKSLARLLRWQVGSVMPNVIIQEGERLHHEVPATIVVYETSWDGSDTAHLSAFLREDRARHTYIILIVDDQPCDPNTRIASLRIRANDGNANEPRWTLHREGARGEDRCVGAMLVKFSPRDEDNLATAIVPLVTNLLRRLFVSVQPEAPILDKPEDQWLRLLRTSTFSDAPTSLIARLMANIPEAARISTKNAHRPLCVGIAGQPELPWEIITSIDVGSEIENRPVVVRVMNGPRERKQQSLSHKLRAVHIVCPVMGESFSSVDNLDPINGQKGQTALRDFVGNASGELRVVSGAKTVDNIVQSCKGGVDLLHIACHARVNENEGGRGELWLAKNNSEYAWVPARDFASALENALPRVVILEACYSGLGPTSVAAELLAVGVSAVVVLQIRPTPEFAAEVMARFYVNLRESFMLDHALRATREIALVVAISDKSGLDALVPHASRDNS